MNFSQLFITIFFLYFIVLQVISATDMIEQTCKSCADESTLFDYNFCVSSLNNSPIYPPPTNLSSLALIPMLQALDNATATSSTIQTLMSDGGEFEADNFKRACLRDCLELYQDAEERLEEAVRVFLTMEAAVTCENGFREKDGDEDSGGGAMNWTSPIGSENYKLFELGKIALCLINKLSSLTSMSI